MADLEAVPKSEGTPLDYRALAERYLREVEALYCTRCWTAWGYGTMSEDDFHLAADDESGVNDLALVFAEIGRARLHDLLEAEAAERVEVVSDRAYEVYGGVVVWRDDNTFCLDHGVEEGVEPVDVTAEELENLGWSCFRALAEKRRREGGVRADG